MAPKKKDSPSALQENPGPSVYQDLLTKSIQELSVNLDQPLDYIELENFEFEALAERLQEDCKRLEQANASLMKKRDTITDRKNETVKTAQNSKQEFICARRQAALIVNEERLSLIDR